MTHRGRGKYGLRTVWEETAHVPTAGWRPVFIHCAREAWEGVRVAPLTSVLATFIIAVILSLLGGLLLFVENVEDLLVSTKRELHLSLFLREECGSECVERLLEELRASNDVLEARLQTKEENLEIFTRSLGAERVILEGIAEENPLPASIEVSFASGTHSESVFAEFAARYERDSMIELVHYNRGLLGQVGRAVRYFRVASGVVLLVMLVITGFVITTTIRLALHSHRDEIEIMRLVGATDSYVRAPFVIEGSVQGLAGGLASIAILSLLVEGIRRAGRSSLLFDSILPHVHFLSPWSSFFVVMLGVVVGAGASWIAVRRFIVSYERE